MIYVFKKKKKKMHILREAVMAGDQAIKEESSPDKM